MSMKEWAEREIEIAKSKDAEGEDCMSGYVNSCYESALKAFNCLLEDGHSGMSIGITKSILNRLIDGKPLTKITDDDSEWELCTRGHDNKKTYQNKRMSSLFKDVHPDGRVSYSDVGRDVCIDLTNGCSYTTGLVSRLIDELYPITMPYYPNGNRIKAYCEDFLTDKKNGDYDTRAILYLEHPTEGRVDINKFYKESETGLDEISAEEYEQRKSIKINRE